MRAAHLAIVSVALFLATAIAWQALRDNSKSGIAADSTPAESRHDATTSDLGVLGDAANDDRQFRPYIPAAFPTSRVCDFGPAVNIDGKTRLALLVGVGEYRHPLIKDLKGPPGDVEKIFRLLTEEDGYDFPASNVCVLVNEAATRANFVEAFEKALVERVKDGAQVVVYFAGHGSQQADVGNDEPDGRDETWLFHDTGFDGGNGQSPPLVDDEFNVLLTRLRNSASRLNISVILDSCNSGTATRGPETGIAVRAGPLSEALFRQLPRQQIVGPGDSAKEWLDDPEAGASYVLLAAAADGTSALEVAGLDNSPSVRSGVFTDALFTAMSRASSEPFTYAEIEAEVRRRVQARSYQVPQFSGSVDARIFGENSPRRPLAWRVTSVKGDEARLGDGPLPGVGVGAMFRIYDRGTSVSEFGDPAAAKAQAEVIATDGLAAKAAIFAATPGARIEPGDHALLVTVGSSFRRLSFRLRPEAEPSGISSSGQSAIRAAYSGDKTAQQLFDLTDGLASFELVQNARGNLHILDPDGRVRNSFSNPAAHASAIVTAMRNHARQAAIRQLSGEGGALSDQKGVKLTVVPRPETLSDAKHHHCSADYRVPKWSTALPNTPQTIPLCAIYEVWAERSRLGPERLQVGGLYLSGDGHMLALPNKEDCQSRDRLGEPLYLTRDQPKACLGIIQALPPLDVDETLIVFGTDEASPVTWSRYETGSGGKRGERGRSSPLVRALDAYVDLQSRAQFVGRSVAADKPYTLTSMQVRIVANRGCAISGAPGCPEADLNTGGD